ncbi:MAG: YggS family pyridoxal phosphate-dependent enzyme [Euryarchaeota archaeon]|nr:YggS family pyridoxal phosphate-dependent enzyme [Euryarchaeota archaeon]|tara:strand:- start:430 stop:1071 length:642 start_codon:yes stop_codon:yes gene_type:complete
MVNVDALNSIRTDIPDHVTLVAVSKTKPISNIQEAYDLGVRDFGENRVQELVEKHDALPEDINWHAIGHLQTNKAKQVANIAHLVHAVDSTRLFNALAKHAIKPLDVLLQLHIASESTKHGFTEEELINSIEEGLLSNPMINIRGVMGMATFTDNHNQIASEFRSLRNAYDKIKTGMGEGFDTVSMGMSGDWKIAIDEGSTLIRVGSAIFGHR